MPSRETARLTGDAVWPASVHSSRAPPVAPGAVVDAVCAGADPASGAVVAARPNGERPIQSSHPPTPLASTTTATAAAATGRRVIRRR